MVRGPSLQDVSLSRLHLVSSCKLRIHSLRIFRLFSTLEVLPSQTGFRSVVPVKVVTSEVKSGLVLWEEWLLGALLLEAPGLQNSP